MFSTTGSRVLRNTSTEANLQIAQTIKMSIEYHAKHPEEIHKRLVQLDREWDIERALETGSSTLSLIGLTLALTSHRRWLFLPLLIQGFFMQHALQGWCPPLPFLRGLGVRTTDEINIEKYALKALRGDFDDLPSKEERAEHNHIIQQTLVAVLRQ